MEKLAKIQRELKATKDQYNDFGKYAYRSAESILEAVKPLLDGAILKLSDELVCLGEGGNMRFYIKATATFKDGDFIETATAYAREPLTKKGMDESQITGTASSYARKYALNGLFCIDDNKDDDTNEHRKEVESTQKSSVEDICNGIKEKMTLDNWKGFYAKAIDLYGKKTPEYKIWIEVFNEVKKELEQQQTKDELKEDEDFLNDFPDEV